MVVANTLTHYDTETIAAVESFIVEALEFGLVIKLFIISWVVCPWQAFPAWSNVSR
jgi:hypothetical protein